MPFAPEVITAVLGHMNDDHSDDNLLIARAFGNDAADTARMTDVDHNCGTWVYDVHGDRRQLVVPWRRIISERAEIRQEIVALYDQACVRLGLEPRPHD